MKGANLELTARCGLRLFFFKGGNSAASTSHQTPIFVLICCYFIQFVVSSIVGQQWSKKSPPILPKRKQVLSYLSFESFVRVDRFPYTFGCWLINHFEGGSFSKQNATIFNFHFEVAKISEVIKIE